MESNDSNTSTKIEQFLKPKAVSSRKLARDAEGRLLMAEESALDMDRIRDAGVTVRELGRRVRLFNSDMTKQLAAYIVPAIDGLGVQIFFDRDLDPKGIVANFGEVVLSGLEVKS